MGVSVSSARSSYTAVILDISESPDTISVYIANFLYFPSLQVSLEFDEENDQRVQLIVHNTKPPFLTQAGKLGSGATFGMRQKVQCGEEALLCCAGDTVSAAIRLRTVSCRLCTPVGVSLLAWRVRIRCR